MSRLIHFLPLLFIGLFSSSGALGNGLYENRPWQFQTSADKANNAFVRDMIERKNGGFYDSFDTIINNNYQSTIEGNQINCNVAPNAIGNESAGIMDANTSSPGVSTGSDIDVNAAGNDGTNSASGSQAAASSGDQTNSGDQTATASDFTATNGPVNASGGTTSQALNNTQTNSGTQQANVTDSEACSFNDTGGGSTLN